MKNTVISKLKTNEVIAALKRRCSWHELRETLKNSELPTGLGWVELESKATENTDQGKKIQDHIQAFYKTHILAGERYVQLYDVPSQLAKDLTKKLGNFSINPAVFSNNYPLPISQSNLKNTSTTPTLVSIEKISNGDMALVFCAARHYSEKDIYPLSQIAPQVAQIYSGIDELITVKKIYFQAFDLVIIRPSLDRIEVCIDLPNLGYVDFEDAALKLLATATAHIPSLEEVYKSNPFNVFNTIKDIFEAPNEGKVKSLAFRTLTGSRKFEKMVRKSEDLRYEKFHQGGMTAVKNEISPYELTVDWKFVIPKGQAEIELKTSIKELSYENPTLTGFYVRAIDPNTFLEAVNKIVKYLN